MNANVLTCRTTAVIVMFSVLLLTHRSSRSSDRPVALARQRTTAEFVPTRESRVLPSQAVYLKSIPPQPSPSDELIVTPPPQRTKPFDIQLKPSEGPRPKDYSKDLFIPGDLQESYGDWSPVTVTWVAPAMSYQPLYFEDVPLERYGQDKGLIQPAMSGARFYFNIASLPYQMTLDRMHSRVYSLGYFRPGSPAPAVCQTLPLELDAAAVQTLVVLALVFALP